MEKNIENYLNSFETCCSLDNNSTASKIVKSYANFICSACHIHNTAFKESFEHEESIDESDDGTSIDINVRSQEDLSSVGLINISYKDLAQGCRPSPSIINNYNYKSSCSSCQPIINNGDYHQLVNFKYNVQLPQTVWCNRTIAKDQQNLADLSNTLKQFNQTSCFCDMALLPRKFAIEASRKRKCVCDLQKNKKEKCGTRIELLKDLLIHNETLLEHNEQELDIKDHSSSSNNGSKFQIDLPKESSDDSKLATNNFDEIGNYDTNLYRNDNFLSEDHFQQPCEPLSYIPAKSSHFNSVSFKQDYNENHLQKRWFSQNTSSTMNTLGSYAEHHIDSSKNNEDHMVSLNSWQNCKFSGDNKEYLRWLYESKFKVGFIDTHCHIDFLFKKQNFRNTFQRYLELSKEVDPFPKSFEGCVAVFCDPQTFFKVSWWESILTNDIVWGAFGCHPHFSDKFGPDEEKILSFALKHIKVKAAGEIGLDYSGRNDNDHELQKMVFEKQLTIALEIRKPIVIHCRDAFEDAFEIMKKMLPKNYLIHLHCFTGSLFEATQWMEYFPNLYFGFTGIVTQTGKRGLNVRRVVRSLPLNRILLETDTPYFRPFYLKEGVCSHPGMAIHVAATIADLRQLPIEKVLEETRINTRNVYNI